ncbi:endothelial lipase-like isoform X3 [Dermacentor albipictus]|uniref:endothelial lipase-like isoform X3 n=1 Tax=Dermacentor albipictus TaxID=60249 RepID=UPI0031FD7AEE
MPGCFCRLVRNNEAGSLYTLQLIEVNVAVTRVSACKRVQCGTFAWDVPSRILNKCKIMLTTMTFILLFLHYKSYASTMGQAGTPNEKEMPAKAKSKDAEEDSNVLVVDWSGLAATTYANAAANTAAVGRTLALVVQRLVEEFPLRAALVHAIGYSFGAQVAGFFGRNIKKNTGTLVARITALDPAGPLFNDTNVCVCPEDAAFVDVIHTSGGYKHQPWQLGLLRPTGHVDFYVNGAKDQPGCCGSALCDHARAPILFLESLVNKACRMVSRPCREGFAAFLRGKCGPTDAGGDRGVMGFFSPRAPGRGVQLVSTGAGPLGYFCNKERKG